MLGQGWVGSWGGRAACGGRTPRQRQCLAQRPPAARRSQAQPAPQEQGRQGGCGEDVQGHHSGAPASGGASGGAAEVVWRPGALSPLEPVMAAPAHDRQRAVPSAGGRAGVRRLWAEPWAGAREEPALAGALGLRAVL